ncbi:unnamed protein product [Phaedon cochleariae]|uniref:CLIP domain-containing serine protease n=1 Tax=Phaedon cochleariae TaxID=80249 RepID=A0A9P0DH53_PHACE|nr:unnamed protein product [Phaedon cochleariae]
MWKVSLIWFSATLIGSVLGQIPEGTPCYSSKQEYGLCVSLLDCDSMLRLLRTRSTDPDTAEYLRSSTCGYKGNIPMVCCPQAVSKSSLIEQQGNEAASNGNGGGEGASPNDIGKTIPETRARLLDAPQCGFTNVTNYRVVGGVPAKLDEFPFIVALGYRNSKNPSVPKWLCGGSLISDRHILTAAHCVHNRKDLYLARVGELDLYSNDEGADPEDIRLIKAKIHENYSPVQFTNDIAILTLERKPRNPRVLPVCLPHAEPLRSNTFLKYSPVVAGWGALYFNGPSSSVLQVAEIPVIDTGHCQRAFGKQTTIDERILCAGWLNGMKDSCQGDSGGPLMFGKSQGKSLTFYQIGIVSYGFRCAESGWPGVYTRVTKFIDWIEKNLD